MSDQKIPAVPLKTFLKSKSSEKSAFEAIEKLFPDLNIKNKETVNVIRLGLKLKDGNGANLYKPVRWTVSKNQIEEGLSPASVQNFIAGIEAVASKLGAGWTPDRLDVIPIELSRDWRRGKNMDNYGVLEAGLSAIKSSSVKPFYNSPPLDKVSSEVSPEQFGIEAYVVAIPSAEDQGVIWGSRLLDLSHISSGQDPKQFRKDWDEFQKNLAKDPSAVLNAKEHEEYLNTPRLLRPTYQVVWNVVSPDKTRIYKPLPDLNIKNNPHYQSWVNEREQQILKVYGKVGHVYAINAALGEVFSGQELKDKQHQTIAKHLGSLETSITHGWDLIDEFDPPENQEQLEEFIKQIKKNKKDKYEIVLSDVLDVSAALNSEELKSAQFLKNIRDGFISESLADSEEQVKNVILNDDLIKLMAVRKMRDAISEVSFLTQKNLEDFVKEEQRYVVGALRSLSEQGGLRVFIEGAQKYWQTVLLEQKQLRTQESPVDLAIRQALKEKRQEAWIQMRLSESVKEEILSLAAWNSCDLKDHFYDLLQPYQEPKEQVIVDMSGQQENAAKENANMVIRPEDLKLINWSPLLDSFGVTLIDQGDVTEEFKKHPFVLWLNRLNPPMDVRVTTLSWLKNNEKFNEINRVLLQKKDGEEANMSAELVQKLNNVMAASNTVLEQTDQNGGWWSRIRKSMTSGDPDQWADSYMDFQTHMLSIFDTINGQIERDKVWVDYADQLTDSSFAVDKKWHEWLMEMSRQLEQERTQAEQSGRVVTAEEKLRWNNAIDVLDSARSAYDNIKVANSINQVMLEKIRSSTSIKERLQQRTTMFYWSSLNMFAGLQSLQRNTNSLRDQAELVEEMSKSFKALSMHSLKEESMQKEKLRDAFKEMSQSEQGMKQFYESIASFQKDTVAILEDMNKSREKLQEETIAVGLSSETVRAQRKKKSVALEIERPGQPTPPPSRSLRG